MSEITLIVGGRNYAIACENGQEEHVRRLAGVVDRKLGQLGSNLASQEAKNLLFAALLLADELEEARSGQGAADGDSSTGDSLERLADRLETTATTLEERLTSS